MTKGLANVMRHEMPDFLSPKLSPPGQFRSDNFLGQELDKKMPWLNRRKPSSVMRHILVAFAAGYWDAYFYVRRSKA